MNSRFKILKLLSIITLSVILVACQDTLPTRSTITPGSGVGEDTCTNDPALVTDQLPLCDDATVTRPTGAISWKSNYCACKDAVAVSLGNCASVCAGKNTNSVETLFANFSVTEAISLSGLGSVHGWCKVPLANDNASPACVVEAKDETGNVINLEVNIAANSNSLTANVEPLSYDKTYVLTLIETVSKAKSNSVQIVKLSTDGSSPVLGPLKNAPVSQYTCIVREYSTDDDGKIYYDSAYRMHFYYIPSLPPDPIPAGNSYLICHDIFNTALYGLIDDILYPRLENIPGVFNLWDTTDPRFYDMNKNGAMDVNDIIIQKTKNFGGNISAGANFFSSFTWPGSPTLSDQAGNNTASKSILGYYMAPWINTEAPYKSYCLNNTHYNSENALYKALRDVIEVETEGLYVGEKAAETVINPDGSATTGYKDYILIREADLKAVWFYLKAGTPTAPTDDNVSTNAVYFYYPLNKTSPFVRTSTQRIYRVRSACELSNTCSNNPSNGNTGTGVSSNYPPHDRKIGCIPKF